MPLATDLMFTEDVVEAVRKKLKGADAALHTNGLPATWFVDGRDTSEVPLQMIEHGSLADYPVDDLMDMLPCILVRGHGSQPSAAGGEKTTIIEERVRVIHLRGFDQCRNASGAVETVMDRARARYAKIIVKSLFSDPPIQQLGVTNAAGTRTLQTLTSADTGAGILDCRWLGTDLGLMGMEDVASISEIARTQRIWAVGIDLAVRIQAGI